MKKATLLLLILAATLAFSACGNDDDGYSKADLQGRWINGEITFGVKTDDKLINRNDSLNKYLDRYVYSLMTGASYTFSETNEFTEIIPSRGTQSGKYKFDGYNAFMTYTSTKEPVDARIAIVNNKLRLIYEEYLPTSLVGGNIPNVTLSGDKFKVRVSIAMDKTTP